MYHKELGKEEFRKFAVHGQYLNGSNVDRYINHVENMTRSVIEERPLNFREVDVFSRLMADRIIFLGMGIDDNIANIIVAQLLFLESSDSKKDILVYINSPGGSVYAGLGIYDTMQYVKPDVATICTSLAASMGAVLLCGGAAGKRSALPHARVMIHRLPAVRRVNRVTSRLPPSRSSFCVRNFTKSFQNTAASHLKTLKRILTATTGSKPKKPKHTG